MRASTPVSTTTLTAAATAAFATTATTAFATAASRATTTFVAASVTSAASASRKAAATTTLPAAAISSAASHRCVLPRHLPACRRPPPSTPKCDLDRRRDTRTDLNHGAVGCDALPTSAYICAAWFHLSDAADGWVQLCERDRRAPSHLGADVGSGVVAKGMAVEVAEEEAEETQLGVGGRWLPCELPPAPPARRHRHRRRGAPSGAADADTTATASPHPPPPLPPPPAPPPRPPQPHSCDDLSDRRDTRTLGPKHKHCSCALAQCLRLLGGYTSAAKRARAATCRPPPSACAVFACRPRAAYHRVPLPPLTGVAPPPCGRSRTGSYSASTTTPDPTTAPPARGCTARRRRRLRAAAPTFRSAARVTAAAAAAAFTSPVAALHPSAPRSRWLPARPAAARSSPEPSARVLRVRIASSLDATAAAAVTERAAHPTTAALALAAAAPGLALTAAPSAAAAAIDAAVRP